MSTQIEGGYDRVYGSRYRNNWISSAPMGFYVIGMFVLDNKTIAEVTVHKWIKFT